MGYIVEQPLDVDETRPLMQDLTRGRVPEDKIETAPLIPHDSGIPNSGEHQNSPLSFQPQFILAAYGLQRMIFNEMCVYNKGWEGEHLIGSVGLISAKEGGVKYSAHLHPIVIAKFNNFYINAQSPLWLWEEMAINAGPDKFTRKQISDCAWIVNLAVGMKMLLETNPRGETQIPGYEPTSELDHISKVTGRPLVGRPKGLDQWLAFKKTTDKLGKSDDKYNQFLFAIAMKLRMDVFNQCPDLADEDISLPESLLKNVTESVMTQDHRITYLTYDLMSSHSVFNADLVRNLIIRRAAILQLLSDMLVNNPIEPTYFSQS